MIVIYRGRCNPLTIVMTSQWGHRSLTWKCLKMRESPPIKGHLLNANDNQLYYTMFLGTHRSRNHIFFECLLQLSSHFSLSFEPTHLFWSQKIRAIRPANRTNKCSDPPMRTCPAWCSPRVTLLKMGAKPLRFETMWTIQDSPRNVHRKNYRTIYHFRVGKILACYVAICSNGRVTHPHCRPEPSLTK